MTPAQLNTALAWISIAEQAGVEIIGGIRAISAVLHPGATDAELDADVDAITAEAVKRQQERAAMLPPTQD